jgi:K+-transporting ATPase c subunit
MRSLLFFLYFETGGINFVRQNKKWQLIRGTLKCPFTSSSGVQLNKCYQRYVDEGYYTGYVSNHSSNPADLETSSYYKAGKTTTTTKIKKMKKTKKTKNKKEIKKNISDTKNNDITKETPVQILDPSKPKDLAKLQLITCKACRDVAKGEEPYTRHVCSKPRQTSTSSSTSESSTESDKNKKKKLKKMVKKKKKKKKSSNKNTDAATKLWTNDNGNWTIEQRTCNICGKIYKNPSSLGSHKYWSHQSKESMNAHITKDSGSLTGELKIEKLKM